jgi:hypothetical protein
MKSLLLIRPPPGKALAARAFRPKTYNSFVPMNAEQLRLEAAARREAHWRRWGPYLSERQWGTVREDYSPDGSAWTHFPHDHARSRAYRWGEDGIAGISDNHQRLCFALAMWNGRDPILKERLFGLTGPEGSHGEDVKEYYYYLDSTPTHSYMKCLYKYPQAEFPYDWLVQANRNRPRSASEFELIDTGVFDENRYFDVYTEYAKADVDDILIRVTVENRGPEAAELHLLPTLWFRNTWSWKPGSVKPELRQQDASSLEVRHDSLGSFVFEMDGAPAMLFAENETNTQRLYGFGAGHFKDAFHEAVIRGRKDVVNSEQRGTKACGWYHFRVPAGGSQVFRLRLYRATEATRLVHDFDGIFAERIQEADEFYRFANPKLSEDGLRVQRQAFAGMLWSKQFYHYVVEEWLTGDAAQPPPPPQRKQGRNSEWIHLFNDDIVSMPDKWEYPWYAAWDSAFHMIPFALIDPEFAKHQLGTFLREWYMHPNGQLPAYEWNFSDVNPPVHAWACWRVFQIDARIQGRKDTAFLESVFHKLLMNFTWWVNRKDQAGNNIFEGGFLGLDNIGLFDRSKPMPGGGELEQSDGTAWMAMYCLNMLKIAIELAQVNANYEDIASKFFEHFVYIANAINEIGGAGLWDDEDGFFYDRMRLPDGAVFPMKVRSMVGIIPMFAVETYDSEALARLPGFAKRTRWFVANRPDLCRNLASLSAAGVAGRHLLSLMQPVKLVRLLEKVLDEREFLSPHGIRSLSRAHQQPYSLHLDGARYSVQYEPAESQTGMFGGNSNWRGPLWFPVNFLLIESLQKYHFYYGDEFMVEFPTGSGKYMNLWDVSVELSKRLSRLFLLDERGRRPVFGGSEKFQSDTAFRDNILFYEYFHGDNGAGIGASHQTGWTGLVAKLLQQSPL